MVTITVLMGQSVADTDHKFATDALNASLTLMSILVAVITIVAIEYKSVQSDPVVAVPVLRCVQGTTAAAALSALIAFLSLLHLRLNIIRINFIAILFGLLIAGMFFGIIWVVYVLVG
jgi:hypothetical protein